MKLYYEIQQLFYYKIGQNFLTKCFRFFITKCLSLLHNATVITKYDGFIKKCDDYYKIGCILHIYLYKDKRFVRITLK